MKSSCPDSVAPTSVHETEFPGGFAALMAVHFPVDPASFARAVDSVFSNSLQPNQFLLVADGPLSGALEAQLIELQARHSGRIEILRSPVNMGLGHALNVGLRHINLPWVARVDSDDFNLPQRFAVLADLLKCRPELDLMSSSILELDERGDRVFVRNVPLQDHEIRRFATHRSPFNHMAVAYRRDTVLDCGGYPEDIYHKEDYALWCRMLAKGAKVANSPEILVHASAGRGMYRRRGGWRYAKSEWQLQNDMVSLGLKSRLRGWLDGLARALVFLAPAGLRGFVYERTLRERSSASQPNALRRDDRDKFGASMDHASGREPIAARGHLNQ